jgi:hypothetical protein
MLREEGFERAKADPNAAGRRAGRATVSRRRRRGSKADEPDPGEPGGSGRDEAAGKPVDRPAGTPDAGSARARKRLAGRVGGGPGKPRAGERERSKPLHRPKPQGAGSAENGGGEKPQDDASAERKSGGKGRRRDGSERKSGGEKGRRGGTESVRAGDRSRRSAERAGRDRDSSRRRRARSGGRRARGAAAGFAAALKRGTVETRRRVAVAAPKLGRGALAALAAVFGLFFAVLGAVLTVLIAVGRVVAGPLGAVLRALDGAARAGSRLLTPVRALTLVVAGAAVLLALSQYADYRSISIGNDAYTGVQTVAPAPETGRLETGDPHSYVFVPIAIACLVLLALAVATRRWRLLRLVSLAGVAAIVVALLVDRPAGLDPGAAAVSFEGVRATLIGGFYAQIAAGVLMIGSSAMLARELRLAGARRTVPKHERPERAAGLVEPRRAPAAPGDARA